MLLDGKKYAESKISELRERVSKLHKVPTLAIIQVAGDRASDTYVQNKLKRCLEVGIKPKLCYFLPNVSEERVADKIRELNMDKDVTGILLQLPLPEHLDEYYLTNLIDPKKDVDGFTETNAGKLALGQPDLVPCTAKGVIDLLDFYNIELEGKDVLIINRSNIVGKPLAQLFLQRNSTVTIAHSKTEHLKDKVKQADIVVTGVGIPNFLRYDDFSEGTTIVDISINFVEGRMCGDIKKTSYGYLSTVGNLTPVPGGIGQTTVIALLENVVQIAESDDFVLKYFPRPAASKDINSDYFVIDGSDCPLLPLKYETNVISSTSESSTKITGDNIDLNVSGVSTKTTRNDTVNALSEALFTYVDGDFKK